MKEFIINGNKFGTKKHYINIPRLIILIYCLTSISCIQNKPEGIFKHYEGYYIGDFMYFPKSHVIRNDTIFFFQIPKAKYIKTKKRLDGNIILEIESFDSNEKGVYIR